MSAMVPLRIVAKLQGPVSLRSGALRIDALLAWAVAARDKLPPVGWVELRPIDIPVEREPGGRFHMASFAVPKFDEHDVRFINRKFPLAEAQSMAEAKLKTINISAGPCKSYRLPSEVAWVANDELEWFVIGDEDAIRELLTLVQYVGHKRATGRGKVSSWTVEPCEPWADGFPIVRDGKPLRALPADWPGLNDPELAYQTLTYPYYLHTAEQLCAVPC
ncbi:MAG: hypothetical protein H0X39_18400 [Actinobacteria bacterium]|nr:hypothetical protein [Actinomycetota bacterium]